MEEETIKEFFKPKKALEIIEPDMPKLTQDMQGSPAPIFSSYHFHHCSQPEKK